MRFSPHKCSTCTRKIAHDQVLCMQCQALVPRSVARALIKGQKGLRVMPNDQGLRQIHDEYLAQAREAVRQLGASTLPLPLEFPFPPTI